jgi:hypothetical protein
MDTVYDLFASGELPGRKVGRKWITTKAAVLRWIEGSSADEMLVRAIKQGKGQALSDALNSGAARVKSKWVAISGCVLTDRRANIFPAIPERAFPTPYRKLLEFHEDSRTPRPAS